VVVGIVAYYALPNGIESARFLTSKEKGIVRNRLLRDASVNAVGEPV